MATIHIQGDIIFSCFLFYLNFPEVAATKPARKRFSDKVLTNSVSNKEQIS